MTGHALVMQAVALLHSQEVRDRRIALQTDWSRGDAPAGGRPTAAAAAVAASVGQALLRPPESSSTLQLEDEYLPRGAVGLQARQHAWCTRTCWSASRCSRWYGECSVRCRRSWAAAALRCVRAADGGTGPSWQCAGHGGEAGGGTTSCVMAVRCCSSRDHPASCLAVQPRAASQASKDGTTSMNEQPAASGEQLPLPSLRFVAGVDARPPCRCSRLGGRVGLLLPRAARARSPSCHPPPPRSVLFRTRG